MSFILLDNNMKLAQETNGVTQTKYDNQEDDWIAELGQSADFLDLFSQYLVNCIAKP